jgi:AAA-like domain
MERLSVESFYVVGGTLARDAPCYVEREADKRLLAALQRDEICYVLTSRQMGKSSLMVRTAVRLREQGTSVAVLDLTSLGQNLTAMQWYNGLLERTGQQLALEDKIEESWLRSEHLGPFQRWVQAMRKVVLPSCRNRIVVFIDEIDTVRSLPFPTDELFAGIRELYNRRSEDPDLKRLTFCLLGVATPSDLIRDTRTTPFNVGRRIELTDFAGEEASPLAPGMSREPAVGQRLLKRILHWTGGHPYLTQRLCQAVAEDARLASPKSVDEICANLFLSPRARERDDNLLFVRDRMLRSEVDTASLLSLYSKVRDGKKIHDDETNPLIGVLRLSGITTIDRGYLKVRNRIYEHVFDQEWINSNLPGSEIIRQRVAYKKGFKRAILVVAPLAVLLALPGFLLYRSNTAPPDLPGKMHLVRPVFWMSSSVRSPAGTGSFVIKTGYENVTVFVNNQQYGNTDKGGSLLVSGLPAGVYNIRAEKPGFQTVTFERYEVGPNQLAQFAIQMQPLVTSGVLKVTAAPPETTVHLDGAIVGTTDSSGSLSINTSPGDHDLELIKDGFVSGHFREHVSLAATDVVNGTLKPDQELRDWREIASTKDPQAIKTFLKQYPDGRFAPEAGRKVQTLEWDSVKDKNDPELLDNFVKRYPQGQYAADARRRMAQIEKEQEDYRLVSNSNEPAALQQFLSVYPDGAYAQSVQQRLTKLKDQAAILDVIRQYQEAWGRKDMNAILRLWPNCPDDKKRHLTSIFSGEQPGTLKLEAKGQPEIAGDHARVVCDKTRVSPNATSKTSAEIKLMKEAGSWFIDGGTL